MTSDHQRGGEWFCVGQISVWFTPSALLLPSGTARNRTLDAANLSTHVFRPVWTVAGMPSFFTC